MAVNKRAPRKAKDAGRQAPAGRAWRFDLASIPPATGAAVSAITTLVIAIGAGLTFRRATTPWSVLPDADYWGNIGGLLTEKGIALSLAELFRHNNEHIVPIPKLIYAANYLATSGSNIGLIVYSLAVGAACAALLVFLARDLLRDTPWRLVPCALLFPLVMFSAKLTHSYFLGMSGVIWLTADLFVILSAAVLAKAVATGRPAWLLASLLAAVLGVLTYSTAVYSLIVLLVSCIALLIVPRFRGLLSRPALIGTVILVAAALCLGLISRNHPANKPAWDFDPIGLIRFVLIYLGNALATGPMRIVVGLVILIAGGMSIRRLMTEGRVKDALLWIILFFFAPFNALMTGIGRLGYGIKIAATSRYQSVTALTLIATIALVLAALPKEASSRRMAVGRAAVVVTLLLVGVVLAANRAYVRNYTSRNENKVIAEIALRQGIEGDQHLKAPTPAIDQLDRLLPVLRAAHHVPFNIKSRCEERLGQHIAKIASPHAGALETVTAYAMSHGRGRAIELSGWAERDRAPECILIVDGDGMAIGSGANVAPRPDLKRTHGRSRGLVGWKAVAALPKSTPVCALALFPGDSQWAPLSDCQASVESLAAPDAEAQPAQTTADPAGP
ncbi:MAG: hypothetical protein WBW08_10640 [Methyloceanibacter sp.]